ncbi:MAG TPA: hypothetical protein VFR58_16605 [Flavisolibacter sp.]|nr:hypothetical protein [Flavisolibacter sp.]
MKIAVYLLAGSLLTGFTSGTGENDIDGIWMGYYRSNLIKEKVIVKFDASDKMEFYTGGVDERTRLEGTYRLLGDSVSFTYVTPEGEEYTMKGQINRRKNFVDGTWRTNEQSTGSFYLERQKVEERFAQP